MQLSDQQKVFLNMIKTTCIRKSTKENVLPSVMAALAIVISDWGTTTRFSLTRNIYSLTVDENWGRKCYSELTQTIYNKKSDCLDGSTLYKVYDSHLDSINDFIDYLVNAKRSKNGPYKYRQIVGCTDFKEVINKLVRAGFMKDYLCKYDDIEYIQNLINIIESYKLFNWDEECKSSLQ